ncbi:hypothetical protein [Streptomyces sp. KMM 9044]|uniref:hypothetical protein n=1 Tax=Streptomyces sp. KMM 9044 TaxID=2744474 RepID=UPI002151D032|nr:hypothetical protein [Streptomyces sp. KMM 9044]WAX76774.1 hypothetical protein HUV60_002895 [Streptomyces sp. KMM 9044]
MQSSHVPVHVSALFDEPNLIADAGLLPLVRIAERAGMPELAAQVRIDGAATSGGAHAPAKVMSLLGAMCTGADAIDDADRLRHGAMDRAFTGIRAPSTLGTFLRSFSHGHNRQLHRVHREFLTRLATHTPLLPGAGQGELFTSWRYHPVFTNSPFTMLEAELHHRQHAIADGKSPALAHLPSGDFQANAAWLTLWAMSHNLLRAAGTLASVFHAKATTAPLRAHLVHVPARLARTARTARTKPTAHLPANWPWRDAWLSLFDAVHHPPAPA